MSITVTTDVMCDKCAQWGPFCCGAEQDLAGAKKAARADGWTFTRPFPGVEHMTCPACNGTEPRYWVYWGRAKNKCYRIDLPSK